MVSPVACGSSRGSAPTINVMAQARRTPAESALFSCLARSDHTALKSLRIFSGVAAIISGPPPGMPVARQHLIGGLRPPRTGRVVREIEFLVAPRLENRLDNAPARLHHILPRIQRRVSDHGVEQQGLISAGRAC